MSKNPAKFLVSKGPNGWFWVLKTPSGSTVCKSMLKFKNRGLCNSQIKRLVAAIRTNVVIAEPDKESVSI